MNPWTPGPWEWEGDSFSDVEPEVCPHGTAWTDHGPFLVAGDEQVVGSNGYDASGTEVKTADARLIQLAPDMAEVLERLVTALNGEGTADYGAVDLAGEDAVLILARARGPEGQPLEMS